MDVYEYQEFSDENISKIKDFLLSKDIEMDYLFSTDSQQNCPVERRKRHNINFYDMSSSLSSESDHSSSHRKWSTTPTLFQKSEITTFSNRVVSLRSFVCTIKNCNKSFTSSFGLKYHMDHGHLETKAIEKRPYICHVPGCSKSYKNNNGLKYHVLHAHSDKTSDERIFN
ncbi:hypothetical protein NUSPORA_02334 [Nucleospora cyclopteri]